MASLTVVILCLNEAAHLERCIKSLVGLAERVVVVDSGSKDLTVEIASRCGAEVYRNDWVSYSQQFNWAIDNVGIDTDWVMRLDADEYLLENAGAALAVFLSNLSNEVAGVTLNLRRVFLGKHLRYGGLYPLKLLRVFRRGRGRCESRWMDEHLLVLGEVRHLNVDFVDHNLKSLSWWTSKHNTYASREAVDILLRSDASLGVNRSIELPRGEAGLKRRVKSGVYLFLPLGFRAFLYFSWRYFLRLGFLDGWPGLTFHFLQAFWYRFLVDAKVWEVRNLVRRDSMLLEEAIHLVLDIDLRGRLAARPKSQ